MAEKHAPDFDAIDRRLALGDGGPAFPRPNFAQGDDMHGSRIGMSLRDYFAAHIVAALMSDKEITEVLDTIAEKRNMPAARFVAEFSYKQADAMLEARK